MRPLKAYILDRFARHNPNYTSWIDVCPLPVEIVDELVTNWQVPDDAGIVITHLHYRWEEIHALRKITDAGTTPVLVLADGVLEYRNTWENPTVSDGAIFQPLIGHKLACIGRGQARVVESWGNPGKCEVVGLPRLDSILDSEPLPIQNEGPFRLLVATANKPAFTKLQRERVRESLRHLIDRLTEHPSIGNRSVEVTWRLTDGLDLELFEASDQPDSDHDAQPPNSSVTEAIENSDAVITTPSTLYFESVLHDRPTAILDYNNSPQYVPSAWTISAPEHLNRVLCELANPSATKMQFQSATLHDQLECAEPATPRLVRLIESMVAAGVAARNEKVRLQLPARILPDLQLGFPIVEANFDLTQLYPKNPVFQRTDVRELQAELSQAIERLKQLPAELDAKNGDVLRKEVHIADLKKMLSEAYERLAAAREKSAEYEQAILQKKLDIVKKNEHIATMEKYLQGALERVQELRDELETVKNSSSSFASRRAA